MSSSSSADNDLGQNEILFGRNSSQKLNKKSLIEWLSDPSNKAFFCPNYIGYVTKYLDGLKRLRLLDPQDYGGKSSYLTLTNLFHKDLLRKQVRKIVYDTFQQYFVIDPTHLGKLKVKLSDVEPPSDAIERGISKESFDFHEQATEIASFGDGVKSFIGIICAIISSESKIFLIDEPEAFLHPSLAYQLGKQISKVINHENMNVIASTHSPYFLMGCIQSGLPVNIIRLTYTNNIPTARLLPFDNLNKFMKSPLLRSTGLLSGLFFEFVIITEGDTDRAFYQEINERLLRINDDRAILNCLFINAQNKQTVWEMVRPLRSMGIPSAGIVDIDMIKDGGQVFTKMISSINIPQLSHQTLQNQRSSIYEKFINTGMNFKTEGGVSILTKSDQIACSDFFDNLEKYGAFIVRNGELESWLKMLGVSGHGPQWLIDIFSKMGENPESSDYLNPSNDDVWDFIGNIKNWFMNTNKRGFSV